MAQLPVLSECKTLQEVHSQSMTINKMATDLVAEPIVQEGYMFSGQNANVAFINIQGMAKKRMQCIFPAVDNWKDPVYERMLMEARLIAAECIHLKYECRKNRTPYDHLKDCTIRIQKMVRDKFVEYSKTIKQIEADNATTENKS